MPSRITLASLIPELRVKSAREGIELARRMYPEAQLLPKTRLFLEEMLGE